jgi:hypothetical protein
MGTKVRVWVKPNRDIRCVNASREKISVKDASWSDFVEIKPDTEFEGNFKNRSVKALKPVMPSATMVDYPMKVRRATEEDIDGLYLMVPQLLSETTLLPVSTQKIEKLIEKCALCEKGAIAGIIDGPDGIDASIGLDVIESDISDHRYVRAIWLGLHPSLRNDPAPHGDPRSTYGRKLFDFARWYHAKLEQDAGYPVLMRFEVATKSDLGPKLGFYERNATPVGATFAYMSGGAFLAADTEAA